MMLIYKMPIIAFNKINWTFVGADLSRPPPMMAFYKITRISVGADLSRLVDLSAQ
jgi:hypothetical protein